MAEVIRRGAISLVVVLVGCGRIDFDARGDAMPDMDVDGPLPPNFVVDISCGDSSSCAVIANGDVYCWGNGNSVGIDGQDRAVATKINIPPVIDVDGNDGGRYAIGVDGVLYGWGPNQGGQLGVGNGQVNPLVVDGPSDVVEISMGQAMGCIRREGGGVECAGAGTFNGTGTASMAFAPVAGTMGARSVSSGNIHTSAIAADGSVLGWGGNDDGQLGNGNMTTPFVTPVAGPPGPYVEIRTGDNHTCARTVAGTVDCWGSGTSGQLGNGTFAPSLTAVSVVGLTDVIQIETGADTTCALRATGEIVCWGESMRGELGDGSTTDRAEPGPVPLISDALQVSARTDVTWCARTRANEVLCWGFNESGQVGIGEETTMEETPRQVMGLP